MTSPLYAILTVALTLGAFGAGRATAPVYTPAPVTMSPKADIAKSQPSVTHAVKKASIHRKTVKKAKVHGISMKKHAQKTKVTKVRKIVLSEHKIAQTHFDCSVVPDLAYQYPRTAVIKAAAEYLPKSSLLKLDYCLQKGGSG